MMVRGYGSQEYRQQDVMGASPVHLVVMAYDVAILACEQKNFEKATRAVSLLRDALDFDAGEATLGLFRLYQWCLDRMRAGDFASAGHTLRELREAWSTVEKQLSPLQAPVAQPRLSLAGAAA